MNIIQGKKIVKTFKSGDKELRVLRELDIEIEKGQFVAITGRSGSGKSTLLYQLGLLDTPNSGEILIDGVNVSELNNEEKTKFRLKELGYVFQDYALVPELNALENVAVPILMQGHTKREAYEISMRAMEKLGLESKVDNLPNQLSGGEQQRVAIARAIAHEPKIIFADEPTANLDSETADNVLNAFLELNKLGQTIVMVTHEPEYAKLTHRIYKLSEGVIE